MKKDRKQIALHFDFKDYKECFNKLRELTEQAEPDLRLIISTHYFTSGYWIENKKSKLPPGDYGYTVLQAWELEKRVEEATSGGTKSPGLIL